MIATKKEKAATKTIELQTLLRLQLCNSRKLPKVVNMNGKRMRWVGIGWVDEGPAKGRETKVVSK